MEAYEALMKQQEEEYLQKFCATIKKDPKSTLYHNNHVEPSALERQESEVLQANQDKVDSDKMIEPTKEAESCNSANPSLVCRRRSTRVTQPTLHKPNQTV